MANISFNKENMTVVDGYFAYFHDGYDTLFYKTDDGIIAYSYPLDTLIGKPVNSLEYDGVNFWTLEQPTTTSLTIKRWKIDNYLCKLQQTIDLPAGGSHSYHAHSFSVEHYHTTVTGTTVASGTTELGMSKDYDGRLDSGMTVTIGPNAAGVSETIGVDGYEASTGILTLVTPGVQNNYLLDDVVQWYNNIWLFNEFDGTDGSTGALYKIGAYTGNYLTKYPGGAYKDINGSTFYNVDSFAGISTVGSVDALCYVKASNLLFVDISTVGETLNYFGSMVLDNDNDIIRDLAMFDQNIYRLEGSTIATNYVLSTLESLVTSISMSAAPAILTANGSDATTIVATVRDQFFQPVQGKLVTFTENGDGFLTEPTAINTDVNGKSSVVYNAGTAAQTVTITATVQQN